MLGKFFQRAATGGNSFITYNEQGGTFIHVNGSLLSPNDFKDFYGDNSFRHFTSTVGFQGNAQPLIYKLGSIAYFMDKRFFMYAPPQNVIGLCNNFHVDNLTIWQNNTAKAIADYAVNKGQNKTLNGKIIIYR